MRLKTVEMRRRMADDSWLVLPWTIASNNRRVSDLKKAIIVSESTNSPSLSISLWSKPLFFWATIAGTTIKTATTAPDFSLSHFTAILRFTLNMWQDDIILCLTRIWNSSLHCGFYFHSEYLRCITIFQFLRWAASMLACCLIWVLCKNTLYLNT